MGQQWWFTVICWHAINEKKKMPRPGNGRTARPSVTGLISGI
jgi:hypothetical protein